MKRILICLGLVLLFACNNKTEVEIPSTILSKDSMTAVLVDIHILEGKLNLNVTQDDNKTNKSQQYYAQIFKAHHITKGQYQDGFKFYEEHPKLLIDIYAKVIETLEKKKTDMEKN